MKQYATYLRVSTQRQGAKGLGISAQRSMCEQFIMQNGGQNVQEFMDVESGTHRDRKGLWQAIDYCKKNGCGLVIAKLDRLARDVEFTFKVINTGIDIHFTDMPVVNSMILGVFSAVAQYEREMVSSRTKAALMEKKKNGCKLGAASEMYKARRARKTRETIKIESMKHGETKRMRFQESKNVVAFLKVLKRVQPEHCENENPSKWEWAGINTKCGRREQILTMMRDFKEMDSENKLFRNWNFEDINDRRLQMKLCAFIQNVRNSFTSSN